jgi:hypothetical protein
LVKASEKQRAAVNGHLGSKRLKQDSHRTTQMPPKRSPENDTAKSVPDGKRSKYKGKVDWAGYKASIRSILGLRKLAQSGMSLSDDALEEIGLANAASLIEEATAQIAAQPKRWKSQQLPYKELELLVKELARNQEVWSNFQMEKDFTEFISTESFHSGAEGTHLSLRLESRFDEADSSLPRSLAKESAHTDVDTINDTGVPMTAPHSLQSRSGVDAVDPSIHQASPSFGPHGLQHHDSANGIRQRSVVNLPV